jgi:hypothetical protein
VARCPQNHDFCSIEPVSTSSAFSRALRLPDFGLPDDADDEADMFSVSVDNGLTIVTENDRHFVNAMRKAASRSGRTNCTGDGFGVIVPNHRSDINLRELMRRLHYNKQSISLDDVRRNNLRVSLGERQHHFSALPRCKFCLSNTTDARAVAPI